MKIIERIEIHRFRSIGDESIITEEMNIYSGVNNSGKSNVLRALNLFFNKETSYDSPYDFATDYNKAFTGQAGGAREIRITLHFPPQGKGALRYPFSISRSFRLDVDEPVTTYISNDASIQDQIEDNNGTITRQFTRFLNTIQYFYIPAVRDKRFVRHLFLNFEQIVSDTSGEDLKSKLSELSDVISARSEDISKDFEQFLHLPTKAVLSSELQDILGSIKVHVDSGLQVLKKKGSEPSRITPVSVDLFSSGDGVLMSYLAYFLAHLCKKTPNKRYIWGFEEPENSLEYSKSQKLADEFVTKFNKYAQIFLTTHSPAFVNLRMHEGVKFYRVYIEPNVSSGADKRLTRIMSLDALEELQLSLFGDAQRVAEYELLQKELGMVEFAREIEEAVMQWERAKSEQERAGRELEKEVEKLKKVYPEKILVIEDGSRASERLWRSILDKNDMKKVHIISSDGCTTSKIEEHLLLLQKNRREYSPRVFRQIDRDGLLDEQVDFIEGRVSGLVQGKYAYKIRVLPVNEVENFALIGRETGMITGDDREDIRDAFELTAQAKVNELARKYNAPDDLFKHGNDWQPVVQKMRRAALADWVRLMPGKDICKRIPNCRPLQLIADMAPDSYPNELREYVEGMKDFFEA